MALAGAGAVGGAVIGSALQGILQGGGRRRASAGVASSAPTGAFVGALLGGALGFAAGSGASMQSASSGSRPPREAAANGFVHHPSLAHHHLSGRPPLPVHHVPVGLAPGGPPGRNHNDVGRLLSHMFEGLEGQRQPRTQAADSWSIDALPSHVLSEDEVAAASEEQRSCTVCMDDFRAGDEQRTLPCFHRFHKECIDRWLRTNGTCPICKHPVDARDATAEVDALHRR